MKTIEVDDELYRYIASQTRNIGESASDILRRLLMTSQISVEGTTVAPKSRASSPRASFACAPREDVSFPITQSEIRIEPMLAMQRMQAIFSSREFKREKRAVGRFMMLLSSLYHIDDMAFSDNTQIKGRTRIYLAPNKEILLASGQTTKPRQIPNTPFWVITNTNTRRKQQIVQQLMERMGFQSEFILRVINTI